VLDDLGPVRAATTEAEDQAAVLIQPRPAVKFMANSGFGHKAQRGKNYRFSGPHILTYRQIEDPRTGDKNEQYLDAAKNPPSGALVHYFLDEKPEGDITLTFFEADGEEIRKFSSRNPEDETDEEKKKLEAKKPKEPRIPKEEGLNRFIWNLRYPDATKIEDDDNANELVEGGTPGPAVPPGTYRVRLQVAEQTFEQEFEVRKDPRIAATDKDLRAQFDVLLQVRDRLSDTHKAINELRAVRRRAEDWLARARDKPELEAVASAAKGVIDRLKPIEAELIQVDAKSRGDTLNFPVRLNGKLASLAGNISSADAAPTTNACAVFDDLSRRVQAQLDQLSETIVTEVGNLNEAIRKADLPAVGV
jgi:hypothetical protein